MTTVTFYTAPCISAHHPNAPQFAEISGRWFSCNGQSITEIPAAPAGAEPIRVDKISAFLWVDALAEKVRFAAGLEAV